MTDYEKALADAREALATYRAAMRGLRSAAWKQARRPSTSHPKPRPTRRAKHERPHPSTVDC